jgi:hypothetical protein
MAHPIEKVAMKRSYYKNRGALPISLLVIHYTAGHEPGDLATLIGATEREVSVHYLVGRKPDFGIKALVPEDKTAWHCGVSEWTDHAGVKRKGCNSFSIGIEISNMGPPEPFTDFQYEAAAQLAREIMVRHPRITLDRIVGHQHISPRRKVDPGPLWDWDRFKRLISEGAAAQAPPLKIVLLADNRVIECNPRVEEGRTRVDMRAVCEALQVALPTGEALTVLHPEVIPPGLTRVDLRPLAEKNGWEVLTHRMAEDHKIYLRKCA